MVCPAEVNLGEATVPPPFWCAEEMTLGLMAPPISWLNWRELAALIGTEACDCALMRPVAGIEPMKHISEKKTS